MEPRPGSNPVSLTGILAQGCIVEPKGRTLVSFLKHAGIVSSLLNAPTRKRGSGGS